VGRAARRLGCCVSPPRRSASCCTSRRVLKRHGLKVDVEYDNGERETVLAENVSPLDVPVEFGAETVAFQVSTHAWQMDG